MSNDLAVPRIQWWKWLPHRRYTIVCKTAAADLVPDRLPRKGLAVVDDGRGPSWIAFDCPCPRRHRLLISLSDHIRPCWQLTIGPLPSLAPSVDVVENGQQCHFWLRDGAIQWAGPTEERRE
ncbi:MAG: DUF6527 family protein [Acidimicrobiales bacterium]